MLLALWALFQFLGMPIYKAIKHVRTSPTLARVACAGHAPGAAARCSAGAAAMFVPMPLRTQAEGVVWLPDNAMLRAGVDGGFSDGWWSPANA